MDGKLPLPLKRRLLTSGIGGWRGLLVGFVDEPAAANDGQADRESGLEMREVRGDDVIPLASLDPEQFSFAVDLVKVAVADRRKLSIHPEEEEVEWSWLVVGGRKPVPGFREPGRRIRSPEVGVEIPVQGTRAFLPPSRQEHHPAWPSGQRHRQLLD